MFCLLGMSKKTEKPRKLRKPEKKITEKTKPWKKPIKILKKPTGSVWFYKLKTGKNELNQTQTKQKQKKPEPNWKKTEPNRKNRAKTKPNRKTEPIRFEPVFVLKNQTEPNRNQSVWTGFGFFFFNSVWLLFFIKNELNRKWSPLLLRYMFNYLTKISFLFLWIRKNEEICFIKTLR